MGKAHPMELRSRVVAFVEQGHDHREAAWHFRVSPCFVNDMVILKRASRGLLPMVQGTHAEGKLVPLPAPRCGIGRQNLPSPVEHSRPSLRSVPKTGMLKLLQSRRIWIELKATL